MKTRTERDENQNFVFVRASDTPYTFAIMYSITLLLYIIHKIYMLRN